MKGCNVMYDSIPILDCNIYRINLSIHGIITNRLILPFYFNIPSFIPCNCFISRLVHMANKQPFVISILAHLIKQVICLIPVFFMFHPGRIYPVQRKYIYTEFSLRLQYIHKAYPVKWNMY